MPDQARPGLSDEAAKTDAALLNLGMCKLAPAGVCMLHLVNLLLACLQSLSHKVMQHATHFHAQYCMRVNSCMHAYKKVSGSDYNTV